jgi:ATP-binding cassette subfamily B protein
MSKKKQQTQNAAAQGRNRYDVDEYLDEKISFSNFKRCFVYISRVKGPMAAALILSLLGSVIGLSGPLITQHAIDVAIPNKDMARLVLMVVLLGGSIIISIAFGAIRNILVAKAGQTIIHDIRYDLFAHLQKLPFAYYDSRPHGKIFVRVVPYVNGVSDALSNGVLNFIIEILNILFIIFFMFQVSTTLATVTILGLPVLALFIWTIKTQQRRAWQRVSNKNSNLNAYVQESVDGVRVTQAFDRQKRNLETLDRLAKDRNNEWMHAQYISNSVWFSTETISQIVFSFIYIVGVFLLEPMASFGMLLAMGNYAWRFWQPIINLANIYNTFITGMSYLDRIFDAMSEPVVIEDSKDAVELPPIRGHVEFQNVSFAYDKGRPILKNVSFVAEPSDSIAIVGPTGAGKTTIVNLLSRFYNIEEGTVRVDGLDIMHLTLPSLRKQMGIMLQDSFIFT